MALCVSKPFSMAASRAYDAVRSPSATGEGPVTHRITLIPGDGTGPEIVEATRRAIEATGVAIESDVHDIGIPAMQKLGDHFPKSALDSIRRNNTGLNGPLTTELGTGMRSVN